MLEDVKVSISGDSDISDPFNRSAIVEARATVDGVTKSWSSRVVIGEHDTNRMAVERATSKLITMIVNHEPEQA